MAVKLFIDASATHAGRATGSTCSIPEPLAAAAHPLRRNVAVTVAADASCSAGISVRYQRVITSIGRRRCRLRLVRARCRQFAARHQSAHIAPAPQLVHESRRRNAPRREWCISPAREVRNGALLATGTCVAVADGIVLANRLRAFSAMHRSHFPATPGDLHDHTGADVMKMLKDNEVKFVDFRFTDTRGKEQHVSVPA